MIERTCQQCHRAYRTFPSIRPKFCSHACASAAKKKGHWLTCLICGEWLYNRPSRPTHRYCSKSCARTARNLTDENPSYHRDISGLRNPSFGKGVKGEANGMFGRRKEKNPNWKGGVKIRKDGYILVAAPDDHPYPADGNKASGLKYILLHRLIMEAKLGCYLDPREVVHHKDGNPGNNSVKNLQLFASQSEHVSVGHRKRKR